MKNKSLVILMLLLIPSSLHAEFFVDEFECNLDLSYPLANGTQWTEHKVITLRSESRRISYKQEGDSVFFRGWASHSFADPKEGMFGQVGIRYDLEKSMSSKLFTAQSFRISFRFVTDMGGKFQEVPDEVASYWTAIPASGGQWPGAFNNQDSHLTKAEFTTVVVGGVPVKRGHAVHCQLKKIHEIILP